MKLLSTILLAFFAWTSSVVLANNNDKILESSRDFSIRCKSLKDPNSVEKRIPVTVYAKYSSKDQKIKINIDKSTDSTNPKPFTLNYPLDLDVFKQKFDSLLSKIKEDEYAVSYGSHLDVFYWIVTITDDSNLPSAGTLTTNQYITVLSSHEDYSSYTERAENIKTEIDQLEIDQSKVKNIRDKINTLKKNYAIYRLVDTIPSGSETDEVIQKLIRIDPAFKSVAKDKNGLYKHSIDSLKESFAEMDLNSFDASNIEFSDDLKNAEAAYKTQSKRVEDENIRKVSHVQYQFEKGYLERIQVYVESEKTDNLEIFENSYPVGFSSISNYRNFTGTKLFRRSSRYETDVKDNFIFLSDIIKLYENELNLATRDYSPGDTTIKVYPSSNPITRLSKQSNFYIIDGKTFTDVTGLSEDSPNGLVQVELSRRFNLWTHRFQVRGSNNFGCVNYVNAKVNFSKIENKLKGLPLRNQLLVENNAIVSPSYATNLDYLRYENLGITMDINAFLFDAPDFKYTIFLDAGIHYGHTPIIDSVYEINQGTASTTEAKPNNLDAHNFTFFPRFKIQLFAERRYGLSFSYQTNYTWLFTNNRFKQVMSYSGKGQDLNTLSTNQYAHWSHTIEAAFYIDINPSSTSGKIFTTARFFFQQGDVNTFYPQILLGYAFNIFK